MGLEVSSLSPKDSSGCDMTEAEMVVNGRRLQLVRASVTLEDVSEAAGVSKSTASRALCNEPNVKRETRERVQAIAQTLGYVPNEAARALAARRAVVIGAQRTAV
jgi:transcriptional regulator with XRE-family HTH domain